MRVLIVYEDSHRSYGEALLSALRASRPGLEVALAPLRELEAELERVDPHLVVCGPEHVRPGRQSGVGAALKRPGRAIGGVHQWTPSEAGEPRARGDARDHRRNGGDGALRARPQGLLASVLIHRAAEKGSSRKLKPPARL